MADKIRIAQIGVGQIGKHHLENYQDVPDAEIVALCDIREDELERVGKLYGVTNLYTDYHEMLKRDDLNSVDVCVHNRLHMPMTVDVLEAGLNCYCEKPMSWTYLEAKAMYAKAKETGRMLHIQQIGRASCRERV